MKTTATMRGASRFGKLAFRARPVAMGCALLALGASDLALAQPVQEVTVTGIRRAVESAIAAKKEADSIVEAVTSEDIGKLPDPSIAESMARLPGVAAQRNKGSGKAQNISVRGMSPDFNGGLLNGREVASSGDSRGVDFDLYPAELLNSVVVYKTPHAGLVGQGLSSTIDLRTIRPLNASGRAVAVNWRGQRTGIENGVADGEGKGERMSLSYIDQFANRTIGVALGYAKFRENGAAQPVINTWGGWTRELDTATGTGAACDTANRAPGWVKPTTCAGVPGGFGRDVEVTKQSREGLMAVLQWKPNKDFETVLDVFQSKGSNAYRKAGIEGFIGGGSDANNNYRAEPVLSNATVVNGIATSGTVNNFKGVIRNHAESTTDDLNAWGLNSRLNLGGWKLAGDLSHSKVVKEGSRFETTGGLTGNGNPNIAGGVMAGSTGTLSWTGFTGSNHGSVAFTSNTDFTDRNVVKLTDVMGWGGGPNSPQAGYVAAPKIGDEIDAVRLSGKRDLSWGPLVGVDAGINLLSRTKTASTTEGFLVINGATSPYAGIAIPGSATTVTPGGIAVASWEPTTDAVGTVYSLRPNTYGTVINRNWKVKEEVATGYAKFDLDGKLFGLDYTGNVGAQWVHTKQTSTGFVNDSGLCKGATPDTCASAVGGTTYDDVLPTLNLSASLGNDMVARLGLGKTIARPKMSEMRANVDAPTLPAANLTQILRASGGNPDLKPFKATALDLSVEKYFGNKGYVSVAGFYKNIDTYILTLPHANFDFKPYISTSTVLPAGGSTIGILSRPTNGSGGTISGVELAVNIPLSMIAAPLDGFGISVNHSDTSSNISIDAAALGFPNIGTVNTPLPGLSRKVTNLRFYYEKHGLQVAVASRSRSDFLGEITDYKDDKEYSYIRGETVVDLQIGYNFSDQSFLKGLSLLFQANNVTNEKFRRYTTDRNNTQDTTYGKTYLFGANYKF